MSPNSPQADDVVLGGYAPPPIDGVILGGLAGVKRRLASVDESMQLAALADAMKYGDAGIELVIDALTDPSERVWQTADKLLRSIDTAKVKEALSLSEMRALAGVKRRLAHPNEGTRISALSEAMKHGPEGIGLVIAALRDASEPVWQTANALLRTVPDPRVKQALALFSAAGIKYTELSELLAAGCWLEADFQTKEALYKIFDLNSMQQFRESLIARLPCEDLQILDRLWVKHSHGRFGFSVQKSIWSQCAASRWEKAEAWILFGDRVGWRSNLPWNPNHWRQQNEITFDIHAPAGHLPFLGDTFGIFTLEAISARLTTCGIH